MGRMSFPIQPQATSGPSTNKSPKPSGHFTDKWHDVFDHWWGGLAGLAWDGRFQVFSGSFRWNLKNHPIENEHHLLGGGFKDFFFSPRSLGKWSNLKNMFQMGWKPATRNLLGEFVVKAHPGVICLGWLGDVGIHVLEVQYSKNLRTWFLVRSTWAADDVLSHFFHTKWRANGQQGGWLNTIQKNVVKRNCVFFLRQSLFLHQKRKVWL